MKKWGISVVLPFPSSLLDAKLIYDQQPLTPIPRITLVPGLLEKKGSEWPSKLVPEHTKNVRLWESKVLMKSSKLPRELACSWGTVYPAITPPTAINPLLHIEEEDRVQATKGVKAGPVVLFAEKVCRILMHIPWSFRFSLSPSIFFWPFLILWILHWTGVEARIFDPILLIYHWFNP